MKTYLTYQRAKVANPESEIYLCDKFIAEKDIPPSHHTYEYRWLIKCNPADYCMTVEQFLKGGHKFVEGDLILRANCSDTVVLVTNKSGMDRATYSVSMANTCSLSDNKRYILRAAALDLAAIAKQTVGYYSKQISDTAREAFSGGEKRVKVKYEKANFNRASLAMIAFENNEKLYKEKNGSYSVLVKEKAVAACWEDGNLYLRIETPMTEREAFIEVLNDVAYGEDGFISTSELFARIVDSGKFKLVN